MKRPGLYLKRNSEGTPEVLQHETPRCRLSWDPDDNRFYVEIPDCWFKGEWRTASSFTDWRNAVQYARTRGMLD